MIPLIELASRYKEALPDIPIELIEKLICKIDELKIMGYNGPLASSKFADYLGYIQIPETKALTRFFYDRWQDHMVRIPIPKELEKYIRSDHPTFTPTRLEPLTDATKYYELGLRDLPGALQYNPGSIQKAPRPTESYKNFIIEQNVPDKFYVMLPNPLIEFVLSKGLPDTNIEHPYSLFDNVNDAQSYYITIYASTKGSVRDKMNTGTLISINSEYMELTDRAFYTQKKSNKRFKRMHGYFYVGEVPSKAIKVEQL